MAKPITTLKFMFYPVRRVLFLQREWVISVWKSSCTVIVCSQLPAAVLQLTGADVHRSWVWTGSSGTRLCMIQPYLLQGTTAFRRRVGQVGIVTNYSI